MFRDRLCMATSARVNEERVVMGTKPVSNKVTSVRPDLVLIKNGVEYGVSEAGKKDEAAMTKKEVIETQLLCPKTMKDMFDRAASKLDGEKALVHKLRIICMNETGRISPSLCFFYLLIRRDRFPISIVGYGLPSRVCLPYDVKQRTPSSCSSFNDPIQTATYIRVDITGKGNAKRVLPVDNSNQNRHISPLCIQAYN